MSGQPMRRSTRTELAALEAYPEEWGRLLDRIAEGTTPLEVCRDRAWSYREWRAWIEADAQRAAAFNFALDCWDETKQFERITIADDAKADTVGVAKLRSETRHSVSSSRPSSRWAAKASGGAGGVTVVIQRLPGEAVVIDGKALPVSDDDEVQV